MRKYKLLFTSIVFIGWYFYWALILEIKLETLFFPWIILICYLICTQFLQLLKYIDTIFTIASKTIISWLSEAIYYVSIVILYKLGNIDYFNFNKVSFLGFLGFVCFSFFIFRIIDKGNKEKQKSS